MRNEEVLQKGKDRNILHTIERKDNWIGHILRKNCLLQHVVERKVEGITEVAGRRGRGHKQLMDGLKETRGYWKLREEALDRTVRRTRFGRGLRPVARQTAEGINEFCTKWK